MASFKNWLINETNDRSMIQLNNYWTHSSLSERTDWFNETNVPLMFIKRSFIELIQLWMKQLTVKWTNWTIVELIQRLMNYWLMKQWQFYERKEHLVELIHSWMKQLNSSLKQLTVEWTNWKIIELIHRLMKELTD